nr:chemotaxis protein [Burkholderia glumae]
MRARFTAGLAARRDELDAAWAEWNALAGTPDAERPRAMLAIALHRLAGAALSYGYDTLGQESRALEARVTANGAQPGELAVPFATIVGGINEALAAASGARPGPPPAPQ